MSYKEPRTVEEARPRPSTYLLAIVVGVAILAAVAAFFAWPQRRPVAVRDEPRLEGALRPGAQEFDRYREGIKVEGLSATQSSRALGDVVMELTATVRNSTGRTITGLEMRGAVVDAQGSPVRERPVVVIPAQQAPLKPGETMSVRVLLEGIPPEAERANVRMEVTGVRVD